MSGPEYLTRDDDIDVVGIFAALKRRWWLIALVAIVTGVGLFFFLSSLDPKYDSNARILIKDSNSAFTRATTDANTQDARTRFDEQAIRSEVEIAGSNNLALLVIDELSLLDNTEFNEDADSGGVFDFLLSLLGAGAKPEADQLNAVLTEFKERLTVYAVEQSRVIVIEFWAHDPKLAQNVVATLADKYIQYKKGARSSSQEQATSWLDPKINELEALVSEKEAAVADYRASEDLLRSNDNNALLATQQLSQISTELSRLKAQRSSAQAKVASIRSALQNGAALEVIPEVLESNLIQRLREREVALRSQISDLSVTLLPNHPRMKSLNSQLSNLERQIRSAAENIVNGLEGNVSSIREAEADLAREIVRLKSESARVDEKLVELRAKEREAQTARELLAEYKSRSLEAKSRAGLSQTDAEIISPATLAINAYFPKVVPFTLAGVAAAVLVTMLGVISGGLLTSVQPGRERELEGQSRFEPANIDSELPIGMPMESELAEDDSQEPIVMTVDHEPEQNPVELELLNGETEAEPELSGNVDAIAVRYAVAALSDLEGGRLVVLSPEARFGSKTSCVIARHLAAIGRSVIVIELGQENSIAREMLDRTDYPGFLNLLTGSITADRAIFKDMLSSAHVMPSGSLFPEQPMPEAEVISDMVDAIASSYDFCVVDCGDANIQDVNVVSCEDTVAIVSCIRADHSDCMKLEDALKADGFKDVLQIMPDEQDQVALETSAA